MKICTKCKELQEDSCFYKSSITKTGLQSICIKCERIKRQDYYYNKNGKEVNIKKQQNNRLNHRDWLMWHSTKTRAKKYNYDFNIEISDIKIPERCPVLNIPLLFDNKIKDKLSSPSVDRIDSLKGYTKDNIIIVSYKVNMIKNNATIDQIEKLYNNWFNISCEFSDEDFKYSISKLIENAKTRSRIKKIEYSLNKEDFKIPKECPIFGLKLASGIKHFQNESPSLDRIDNSLGYTKDNVRIISWLANKLKGISTYEEYSKIYHFYKKLF